MSTDNSVDMVAFVSARLAEDEQVARAVGEPDLWRADSSWAADLLNPLPSQRRDHPSYVPLITQADLGHIARHDPARVLREVEAKRRMLGVVTQLDSSADVDAGPTARRLATLLALPYADHPDYREEWRPVTWRDGA